MGDTHKSAGAIGGLVALLMVLLVPSSLTSSLIFYIISSFLQGCAPCYCGNLSQSDTACLSHLQPTLSSSALVASCPGTISPMVPVNIVGLCMEGPAVNMTSTSYFPNLTAM